MEYKHGLLVQFLELQTQLVWKIHVEMGSRNGDFNVVGMAIGLHLNIKNVNSFVTNKIHKKIKFWGIVHLPLAGKQSSSALC